jgi:NAD(P)H-dependent flavin oxidoreductase YrpB (nitropropane dioxygenase family)
LSIPWCRVACIPMIASGGFADARGLVAALALS